MNIAKQIAEELKIKVWQVEAVMELIDEGCTIPFIARYRKEKHGSLNDEQLRNLDERLTYLRNLEERKETVLASIEEQGKNSSSRFWRHRPRCFWKICTVRIVRNDAHVLRLQKKKGWKDWQIRFFCSC